MQKNSIQHLWAFLSGKKTYIISLAGAIYAWGITQNLWQHSPVFDILIASAGAASLRHGINNPNINTAPINQPAASPTPSPVLPAIPQQ